MEYLAREYKIDLYQPWGSLTAEQQHIILYGDKDIQKLQYGYYPGVIPLLEKTYKETNSEIIKQKLEQYLEYKTCEVCGGKRLKPAALAVKLGQYTIDQLTEVTIRECLRRIENLQLTPGRGR